MADCDCDEYRVIFSREGMRKARKPHICGECKGEIAKGKVYFYWRGKVADLCGFGEFTDFKMCLLCYDDWDTICKLLDPNELCLCYGGLGKNVWIALDREYIEETDPLAMRWLGDPRVVSHEELEAAGQLRLTL